MWSDQCLEVDGCSSVDGLEGQRHHLELDAGYNRKPVVVMEEEGHMENFWIHCNSLVTDAGNPAKRELQ